MAVRFSALDAAVLYCSEDLNLDVNKGHIENYIITGEILDVSQKAFGGIHGLESHGTNHYIFDFRLLSADVISLHIIDTFAGHF